MRGVYFRLVFYLFLIFFNAALQKCKARISWWMMSISEWRCDVFVVSPLPVWKRSSWAVSSQAKLRPTPSAFTIYQTESSVPPAALAQPNHKAGLVFRFNPRPHARAEPRRSQECWCSCWIWLGSAWLQTSPPKIRVITTPRVSNNITRACKHLSSSSLLLTVNVSLTLFWESKDEIETGL